MVLQEQRGVVFPALQEIFKSDLIQVILVINQVIQVVNQVVGRECVFPDIYCLI